ncbi:hypothetical protein JCM8097_000024 [Rhodosporidiobolus ruineniae]
MILHAPASARHPPTWSIVTFLVALYAACVYGAVLVRQSKDARAELAGIAALPPLRVEYTDTSPSFDLFRSTDPSRAQCQLYSLALEGAVYPVTAELVTGFRFADDFHPAEEGVEVVKRLEGERTSSPFFLDLDGVETGTKLSVRVTDAAGRVAITLLRTVKDPERNHDGQRGRCLDIDEGLVIVLGVVVCVVPVGLLFFLLLVSSS